MNGSRKHDQEAYRALLLMAELEEGRPISQREIAGRLGIALGLVNAYLKNLVAKGLVNIRSYPRNRYGYLLTPRGFAEKSRFALDQLTLFHRLFRITRQDSLRFFQRLHGQGAREVTFCGVDEFTEIAYLSLREARIALRQVMDDHRCGERFLDLPIVSLEEGLRAGGRPIVVTSLRDGERYLRELRRLGVRQEEIFTPVTELL